MSATPRPPRRVHNTKHARRSDLAPASMISRRAIACREISVPLLGWSRRSRSALDLGRPGLLNHLDDRIRHRNVIELLGHFVAMGKSPSEELDGFLRGCLVGRILVHQDE